MRPRVKQNDNQKTASEIWTYLKGETNTVAGKCIKKRRITKETKKLIEKVTETCDRCHNNKKQDRKNKMVTYRSEDFNESVSIDLTEWFDKKEGKKKVICHMIDEFSRLSAVSFISDKTPNSVMRSVTEQWISNYGTCQKLLHDLGGEFNGEELRDLLGTMGIRVSTTAASPTAQSKDTMRS